MKRPFLTALCAGLLVSTPAMADRSDTPKAYFGVMGSYVLPDSLRKTDDGFGGAIFFGRPVNRHLAVEINAFGHENDNENAPGTNRTWGGGIDLRLQFGDYNLAGFLIGGIGAIYEDFANVDEESSPYANIGLGTLIGLTDALALRGEARYYAIANDVTYAGEKYQYDTRFNLGLQYAFFAPPPPPPPPAPAPVIGDQDNDGVNDNLDQCPNTPAGTPVDARGCPVVAPAPVNPDLDGDGVPNALDRCPDTPPNFKVNAQGCVEQAQVVTVLSNVLFAFNSSALTPDAQAMLTRVADGLQQQTDLQITIAGHTDSIGTDAYNLKLSRERAGAVKSFLIGRGISPTRLKAEGYGESRPVASNDTDDGRAMNRRVEFHVTRQ